jgi:hypothetical protein
MTADLESFPLPQNLTFDLKSSPFLQNLDQQPLSPYTHKAADQQPLPPYTHKAADQLTFSSLSIPKMADHFTTIYLYAQFVLILVCLIGAFASMPFINMCQGGGSIAGTLALTTGVGLVFTQYWKVGFLCQDEEDKVPRGWNASCYYVLVIFLPLILSVALGLVLTNTINNCCKAIPPSHQCTSPLPTPSLSPPSSPSSSPSTTLLLNQAPRLSSLQF